MTEFTSTADWWFVSIAVEMSNQSKEVRERQIGIDLGLNHLVTIQER